MTRKTLIVYSSRTGINSDVAHAMAEVLEAKYEMDVTIADLNDGQPDIAPFHNVIVGGGVDSKNVYGEAVDFLEKNFEGKNVALYFGCEDYENPKEQSTEENSRKVLAKNKSLLPVSVAAFGGCMIKQGKPVMDELNMNRVRDWATELGKNFIALAPIPVVVEVIPVAEHAKTKGTEEFSGIHSAEKFRFLKP
jgi:menaquinone-dependent protoporphyrinogen IX oxidase